MVFGRLPPGACKAMLETTFGQFFFVQTPTRRRTSAPQIVLCNSHSFPAITDARPARDNPSATKRPHDAIPDGEPPVPVTRLDDISPVLVRSAFRASHDIPLSVPSL